MLLLGLAWKPRGEFGGLSKLPEVTGGSRRSSAHCGEFGGCSKNTVEYADQALKLRAYIRYRLGPALTRHFHVLGQMLGESTPPSCESRSRCSRH